MDEPIFYSARGTSRKCALPNFDYLYGKYALQRNYRVRYLYDEYVQACERAGERPYTFKSFYSKKAQWRRGDVRKTLPPWHPGERLFCCWSHLPDNLAGTEKGEPRLMFVAVFPYSEYTFICASEEYSRESWMRCCAKAYRFFGGVPHITEGQAFAISSTKSTELTLQAFAAHYRTVLYQPCPKTQKTASERIKPLMSKCTSIAAMEVRKEFCDLPMMSTAKLDERLFELTRKFNSANGDKGVPRKSVFNKHEAPQLLSLPEDDYDLAVWTERAVGRDYHFAYNKVRYSVPYQYAHETVRIRATKEKIEAYSSGALIASHRIPKDAIQKLTVTDPAHRPSNHAYFANRLETRFMALAKDVGPAAGAIMKEVLFKCEKSDSKCYRPCKDLLDLQSTPSGITLEEACSKVLADELDMTVESVFAVMQAETS